MDPRNELAARGYSRDHRSDRPQVVYGLPCNAEGCPVAVPALAGNTADRATLAEQVANLRDRFGLERVSLVGDRGMIDQTHIDQNFKTVALDWITALHAPPSASWPGKSTSSPACSTPRTWPR